MPKMIREAGKLGQVSDTGRAEITLITPGWGSSGYYSAELLQRAAEEKVFPAGTQQHIDHLSEEDQRNRPAGSLMTLAAVLQEDARWNGQALVAESLIGSRYRDIISEFAEHIGTSIAVGADVKLGEAEGRRGQIVQALYPDVLNRVDFVTAAGRGGKINKILESVAAREALTDNDRRDELRDLLRAAYGDDATWVWVLDSDEANVWFTVESETESTTYASTYALDGDQLALTGDPVEVKAITTYQPIDQTSDAVAEDSPPALAGVTEGKEPLVALIQIEDAEYAGLKENASRATALEAENGTLKDALLESKRDSMKTRAEQIVAEAFGQIEAPSTRKRLAESYTVTESGDLDEPALKQVAEESAAEIKRLGGAGTVRGVGQTSNAHEAAEPENADVLSALREGK